MFFNIINNMEPSFCKNASSPRITLDNDGNNCLRQDEPLSLAKEYKPGFLARINTFFLKFLQKRK